jgi:hypothetical protein
MGLCGKPLPRVVNAIVQCNEELFDEGSWPVEEIPVSRIILTTATEIGRIVQTEKGIQIACNAIE